MISGWHHHGDYDTSIYVVSGGLRMECGPGGTVVVEAGPGDFLHVPKGAIHRESNPQDTDGQAVVVRAGQGPPVFNVDGPAPALSGPTMPHQRSNSWSVALTALAAECAHSSSLERCPRPVLIDVNFWALGKRSRSCCPSEKIEKGN